jgi:cell division protein FtsB
MKTLVGGAIAAVLGIIGITKWYPDFLTVLAGVIPVMLLLGGALAIYLGVDELKDSWKCDNPAGTGSQDDIDRYKQEIDQLKKEIDDLKGEKS